MNKNRSYFFKYPCKVGIRNKFHVGDMDIERKFIFKFQFDNGYGASVITDGYGKENELLELAVTKNGGLCYTTKITGDVIGNLTLEEVNKLLDKIKKLCK